MSARIVKVAARYCGGTYMARAGRGKATCRASYTGSSEGAARKAAAKFFRLDATNVQTEYGIVLAPCASKVAGYDHTWLAELPESKGGAA